MEMRPLTAALVVIIVGWAVAFLFVVLGNLGVPLVGHVGGGLGYLVLYGIPVVFYLIPTLAAASEKHHNLRAIAALNILLGWTALGWIAALIWALTKPHRD